VAQVSDRVRRLRKGRGLTQEEVARRAGLTLNSYGDIERGHVRDPHLSSLEAIAQALGVSIEALVSTEMAVPLVKGSSPSGPEKQLPEEAGEEWHPDDEVSRRRIYTGLAAERADLLESTAELWERLLDGGERDVDTLRQIEHVTLQEIINHAIDVEEIKERCAPEQRDELEHAEQRLLEADRRVSRAIDAELPSLEIDKRRAARAERQAKFPHLGIPELA
jgi:transcriptional regulator with XRE-family HTH domain